MAMCASRYLLTCCKCCDVFEGSCVAGEAKRLLSTGLRCRLLVNKTGSVKDVRMFFGAGVAFAKQLPMSDCIWWKERIPNVKPWLKWHSDVVMAP